MNGTRYYGTGNEGAPEVSSVTADVRRVIASAKSRVLAEYGDAAAEHGHVLRLALNEAEALAWQTEFPHLFFPDLAAEKAQTAVQWHQRQRQVRRGSSEIALAE